MQPISGTRSAGGPALPRAYVVEDDPMMLLLLSDMAAAVGLRPLGFTRLASARRAVRERPPTVLVIDDELPDGSGGDFVRALRDDPMMREVKVIVCTSAGPARRRQIAGVAAVIAKPFVLDDMETALRVATS